jgi:hypothetical protein
MLHLPHKCLPASAERGIVVNRQLRHKNTSGQLLQFVDNLFHSWLFITDQGRVQDASKCRPIGSAVLEGHDGAAQVLGLVCRVCSLEDNSHIGPVQVASVGDGSGVVDNLFYFPSIQQGKLQPRGV